MKWIAAAVLTVTAWQDVREREIGLAWVWLFAIVCAGRGDLMNLPERIFAVLPGLLLMAFNFLSPASVGEGDALMVWGMGFGFPPDAVWGILATAVICAGLAGVSRKVLSREKGEESLPFLLFLLGAFLLWFPLL